MVSTAIQLFRQRMFVVPGLAFAVADHARRTGRHAGHQAASGRDAAWRRAVRAGERHPASREGIQVRRFYDGMVQPAQAVASPVFRQDEQQIRRTRHWFAPSPGRRNQVPYHT